MLMLILAQRKQREKEREIKRDCSKILFDRTERSQCCSSRYVVNFRRLTFTYREHDACSQFQLPYYFLIVFVDVWQHRRPIYINEGHSDHRCSSFDCKNFPLLCIIGWKYASARQGNDVGERFRDRLYSRPRPAAIGNHRFQGKKKKKKEKN